MKTASLILAITSFATSLGYGKDARLFTQNFEHSAMEPLPPSWSAEQMKSLSAVQTSVSDCSALVFVGGRSFLLPLSGDRRAPDQDIDRDHSSHEAGPTINLGRGIYRVGARFRTLDPGMRINLKFNYSSPKRDLRQITNPISLFSPAADDRAGVVSWTGEPFDVQIANDCFFIGLHIQALVNAYAAERMRIVIDAVVLSPASLS